MARGPRPLSWVTTGFISTYLGFNFLLPKSTAPPGTRGANSADSFTPDLHEPR